MTAPVVDAQPLVAAIKAAITGVALGEGKKPTVEAGLPYVVVWFDNGTITDRSLRSRDGFELGATFQCYGGSPDAVRFGLRKVRAAAMSVAGTVIDGRTVKVPSHSPGPPMDRDDVAQPPLFWQPDEWTFRLS